MATMTQTPTRCPEQTLEQIFQRVEEESERRAEEEQRRAAELAHEASIKKARTRRRGSVSISRLGQINSEDARDNSPTQSMAGHGSLSPTANGFSIASSSPFYQAQIANASTSSIASGASAFSNEHAHMEDQHQVVQVEQLKQSAISRIIPRRLSRTRSSSIVLPNNSTHGPIGVSVRETTTTAVHASVESISEVADSPSRRVSVHAEKTLKTQSSMTTVGSAGSRSLSGSWVARAKGFTQKFRRKASLSSQA